MADELWSNRYTGSSKKSIEQLDADVGGTPNARAAPGHICFVVAFAYERAYFWYEHSLILGLKMPYLQAF